MSQPWWVKGSSQTPPPTSGIVPVLLPTAPATVIAELSARIAAYTPEWTARGSNDAGVALLTLFGGMMKPVLSRLDQLPQKAFVEALRIIGIEPLAAEPAVALLQFTILASATGPVPVPQGFQVAGCPASGTGNLVIFQTQDNLLRHGGPDRPGAGSGRRFLPERHPRSHCSGTVLAIRAQRGRPARRSYLGLQGPTPQIQISIGIDVVTPAGTPARSLLGDSRPCRSPRHRP